MPTIDMQMGVVAVVGYRPDVLQLTNLDPADGTTQLPPGYPITFDLHTSCPPWVDDFEDGDNDWLRCTYAAGYTQSQWNSGGSDEWSLIDDGSGSNQILKCSARGTNLAEPHWNEITCQSIWHDSRVRVQYKTGGGGGICARFRWGDNYGKTTQGVRGPAIEIDSGGCRKVFYHWDNTRDVRATSSFTPTDGDWYWVRMQVETWNGSYYYMRGKYWQGELEDEPASWTFGWTDDFATVNSAHNWTGCGLHNYTGELRFDDYAIVNRPSDDYLALLSVEVNGVALTTTNGMLEVEPQVEQSTRHGTYTRLFPIINQWRVKARCDRLPAVTWQDNSITVVVKFRGATISSTDYDCAGFPTDPPLYDPADSDPVVALPPGDPTRMGSFGVGVDGTLGAQGRKFTWLATLFAQAMGYALVEYNIAPAFWGSWAWGFVFNVTDPLYTPVNGRYLIAHPVWQDVPAAVVPADVVAALFPASVVPQGAQERLFPANVVAQGYLRRDFPVNVLPAYQLWYEGAASGLVGAEVVRELDASGLVFRRRQGSTIHLEVVDTSVYDQLTAMGIVLSGNVVNMQMGRVHVLGYNMEVNP